MASSGPRAVFAIPMGVVIGVATLGNSDMILGNATGVKPLAPWESCGVSVSVIVTGVFGAVVSKEMNASGALPAALHMPPAFIPAADVSPVMPTVLPVNVSRWFVSGPTLNGVNTVSLVCGR